MTTRNAAGAYPTSPCLSSTSLQFSFSACNPLKTSVSHCWRSISFPIGLSGFLVYAWVAISVAPEHISFLSSVLISPSSPVIISSVLKFPAASSLACTSPTWFTPIVVTLLPVSAPLSSYRSPATISFVPSTICRRPSTSFTKATPSVHPLHVNTNPSTLVSAHFFSHPEPSCCIQLAQFPQTRCLLGTTFLFFCPILVYC